MVGVVCILAFSFVADYLKNKWAVLGIVSGVGTILFVAVTAASDQMARCKSPDRMINPPAADMYIKT